MDQQKLIERYIDLDTDRYPGGRADARLRDYEVSVWALIGQLRAINGDAAQLARDFELPTEAVEAVLARARTALGEAGYTHAWQRGKS